MENQGHTGRDLAIKWAQNDPDYAIEVARKIAEPWYRCQSLAWIARYSADDRVCPLADEAVGAALEATDRHRTVAGAAWPVRALVERGFLSEAAAMIRRVLPFAVEITHSGSRADALQLLFEAGLPAGASVWSDILDWLIVYEPDQQHWRRTRAIRDAILMMHAVDPVQAANWLDRVQDKKAHAQALRGIAGGNQGGPRMFFWLIPSE